MAAGDDAGEHAARDPTIAIVRELAKLGGEVHANFTTVFKRLDRQDTALEALRTRKDDELGELRDRVTKLEARAGLRPAPRKRLTAARWGAIGVAIVTILGGLSAAYHQAETLVEAIGKALHGK